MIRTATKQTDIEEITSMNIAANPVPSADEIMNLPVFGPADLFPMLADDELQELAEDIRENGLKEPLVIGDIADEDGEVRLMLIDGRNRREACRIASVEPAFRHLGMEDPAAFVLSVNVNRRHMTAGQRAAARALLKPEGEQGKRSDLATSFVAKEVDVSPAALSKARCVLRFEKPLLFSVLNGSTTLDAAYAKAKETEKANSDKVAEQAAERAKLDALRKRYPDLARRVEEEGIGLRAMLVEAGDRDAAAKSKRTSLFMGLRAARAAMVGFADSDELPKLPGYLKVKELKAEFIEEFRDKPSALIAMIPIMEAELAALKEIISQIEGA